MVQLDINGVNEELTQIFAHASEQQLTPASILSEMLSQKNIVYEYLSGQLDVNQLRIDIEAEHQNYFLNMILLLIILFSLLVVLMARHQIVI